MIAGISQIFDVEGDGIDAPTGNSVTSGDNSYYKENEAKCEPTGEWDHPSHCTADREQATRFEDEKIDEREKAERKEDEEEHFFVGDGREILGKVFSVKEESRDGSEDKDDGSCSDHDEMMRDPEKAEAVTAVFMPMKKLDLEAIRKVGE
jgi:hypothetical protein